LLPIDRNLTKSITVSVSPFAAGALELGFTRGYVQSEGFVHQFGPNAPFRPAGKQLLFDTSSVAGTSTRDGKPYTFAQEYSWSGFTARAKVFDLLTTVVANPSLHLDVFAYDLNEPDVMRMLLKLASQGRVRIILDDAPLHHRGHSKKSVPKSKPKTAKSGKAKKNTGPTAEDQFETQFNKSKTGSAAMLRGHFGRYAHDKIFIVSKGLQGPAQSVLTGSTNLSVTGLYVNSNHVLIFNEPVVAQAYAEVFEDSWQGKASHSFANLPVAAASKAFSQDSLPHTTITFSPHTKPIASKILSDLATRIASEGSTSGGSVLFAVMDTGKGGGPVLPALVNLHKNTKIFSYGISDSSRGIFLYSPRSNTGVKVTGKPGAAVLPPPFDQVPTVGKGHQIHHKFVVCGFNGKNPVVYCGSSNFAEGGEEQNGDNLIAIHDHDVATAFTIEALALVDHFDFLDKHRHSKKAATKKTAKSATSKLPSGSKQASAAIARWNLSTTDAWAQPYFDPKDLHCMDRLLFA
jgi:phosphatidylserine/phosphatidylglycerophosphate/cardiolipin synthase-like enzyme